jgi:hypothetical protein
MWREDWREGGGLYDGNAKGVNKKTRRLGRVVPRDGLANLQTSG